MSGNSIISGSARRRSCLLLSVFLAGGGLAGCDKQTGSAATNAAASPAVVTEANVAKKVAEASTPADHEAIASYYESRAQGAQRESGEDRDLQERYEHRMQRDNHPMAAGARDHLHGLSEGHEASARHYRAMAEWHREMAHGTEQPSTSAQ